MFEKCEPGDNEAEVAARLVEDGIDGVVLTPPLCESLPVLRLFDEAGIPTVLLATAFRRGDQLAVTIDDRCAAHDMTRHLVALGHGRIGFIAGDPNLSTSAHRLQGYRDALRASGLPAHDALVAAGLYTYRSGLDAAERLLDLDEPPTAIFASNDDMAAAVVAVAHRHALDLPGDLTVVGFDDTTLATAIWPELTTIRQPIADMSRLAVKMLVDAIRGRRGSDAEAAVSQIDFTLIRRQSDAAPRCRPSVQRLDTHLTDNSANR